MATPRVPIVKGQYPIPYGDPIDCKKIRFTRQSLQSKSSPIPLNEHHITSSEDEDYDEDEYVVEKIISHRNKPDASIKK